MRYSLFFILFIAAIITTSFLLNPTFNGATVPGCGNGCHDLGEGAISVAQAGNLQVAVTVNNPGSRVAGELVDETGAVVDYVNSTESNPFTLTAPQEGTYRVNAGVNNDFAYDSAMVTLVTSAIGAGEPEAVVKRFELYPNHPNPFNNVTLIRFSVPAAKDLSLNIYNMNGQRVRKLTEGSFAPGIYSFKWDGRNDSGDAVTSGVYVYELRGEGYREAKKLTLSK